MKLIKLYKDRKPILLEIFAQSKANGAAYEGDKLEPYKWKWPTETWLQRRMAELQKEG